MSINNLINSIFLYPRPWVLTGAGISTESGIPDFRSSGGMWEKIDPMENFSVWALYNNPQGFYTHGTEMFQMVLKAEPNLAHKVLGDLQRQRIIGPIVTQNVDNLHHKGGASWVYEVHGHLRTATCLNCRKSQVTMDELIERVKKGEIPPQCECGGILKPDVILFGDAMPDDYSNTLYMLNNYRITDNMILVIGSSLTVSPINSLPMEFARLNIINGTPTIMDNEADIVITGSAGQVLGNLYEELIKLNAGKELKPLPAGFMPGRLVQILEDNFENISGQKNRKTIEAKAARLQFDINLVKELLDNYPEKEGRQQLEKYLLKEFADRTHELEEKLKGLCKGRIPAVNEGNLFKYMYSIIDGYNRAIYSCLKQDGCSEAVLVELILQFLGTVGLYNNIYGESGTANCEFMLKQVKQIISDRNMPVDMETALKDF